MYARAHKSVALNEHHNPLNTGNNNLYVLEVSTVRVWMAKRETRSFRDRFVLYMLIDAEISDANFVRACSRKRDAYILNETDFKAKDKPITTCKVSSGCSQRSGALMLFLAIGDILKI